MAHLGLCWPILTLSWACFNGLAGLSWGHWALLWATFGVWRVAFGGWEKKNGDVVENQKMWKNTGKRKKCRQVLDVQQLGAKVGYMGLSKV